MRSRLIFEKLLLWFGLAGTAAVATDARKADVRLAVQALVHLADTLAGRAYSTHILPFTEQEYKPMIRIAVCALMKLLDGLYVYEKPGMGQFGSHTYVLVGTKQVLLIDPGFENNVHELVVKKMVHDGIDPHDVTLVANTHLHADHSQADETFAKLAGARIVMHTTQLAFLDTDASADEIFSVPKHIESSYGSEIDLGGVRLRVIETQGHAPGHVCFYWPEKRALISGDMVFENNVGRFDLPGGDFSAEQSSIRRLAAMDVALLLPSHGKIFLEEGEVRRNFETIIKEFDEL